MHILLCLSWPIHSIKFCKVSSCRQLIFDIITALYHDLCVLPRVCDFNPLQRWSSGHFPLPTLKLCNTVPTKKTIDWFLCLSDVESCPSLYPFLDTRFELCNSLAAANSVCPPDGLPCVTYEGCTQQRHTSYAQPPPPWNPSSVPSFCPRGACGRREVWSTGWPRA